MAKPGLLLSGNSILFDGANATLPYQTPAFTTVSATLAYPFIRTTLPSGSVIATGSFFSDYPIYTSISWQNVAGSPYSTDTTGAILISGALSSSGTLNGSISITSPYVSNSPFITNLSIPVSGPLSVDITVANLSSSAISPNAPFTFGHAFANQDIPSGYYPTLTYAGSAISAQADQVSLWKDNSYKFAAFAAILPTGLSASGIAGSAVTLTVSPTFGSAPTGQAANLSDISAANIYCLFTSGDAGYNNYVARVSDIIASGTAFPWGGASGTSYPLRGYYQWKSGPVCCEWDFWTYLFNQNTSGYHQFTKAHIYVRAWGPTGPFEITPVLCMDNFYGPNTNGSEGNSGRFACLGQVYCSGQLVANLGGSVSPFSYTIAASSLSLTNSGYVPGLQVLNYPGPITFVPENSGSSLPVAENFASGYPFYAWDGPSTASSGAMITNWPVSTAGSGGGNLIGTNFSYTSLIAQPNPILSWAASAQTALAGGGNSTSNYYMIENGGVVYVAVVTGTTASGGTGPTGWVQVQDGTAQWQGITPYYTAPGSGTLRVIPYIQTLQGGGSVGADVSGNPFWFQGSSSFTMRPNIVTGLDLTYLFKQTKATPPYSTNLTPVLYSNYNSTLTPYEMGNGNGMTGGPFGLDQNVAANYPGTQRIGYLTNNEVTSLYMPFDLENDIVSKAMGYALWGFNGRHIDERSGAPVVLNNGYQNTGSQYTGFGPNNPAVYKGNNGFAGGNPNPFSWSNNVNDYLLNCDGLVGNFNGSGYYVNQGPFYSSFALAVPFPTIGSYIKTGWPVFAENLNGYIAATVTFYFKRFQTFAGTNFYNQMLLAYEVIDEYAWWLRTLTQIRHFIPNNHYSWNYINDAWVDCFSGFNYWKNNVAPFPASNFGLIAFSYTYFNPYALSESSFSYLFYSIAMEAWRNENHLAVDACSYFAQNFKYWLPEYGGITSYAGLNYFGLGGSNFVASTLQNAYPTAQDAMASPNGSQYYAAIYYNSGAPPSSSGMLFDTTIGNTGGPTTWYWDLPPSGGPYSSNGYIYQSLAPWMTVFSSSYIALLANADPYSKSLYTAIATLVSASTNLTPTTFTQNTGAGAAQNSFIFACFDPTLF